LGSLAPNLGAGWRLQRTIGLSRAREALFANRPIASADALRTGLVSAVTPEDGLDAYAEKLANEMLECQPDALRLTKRSLDHDLEVPTAALAMEAEERAQMLMIARRGRG